MYQGPQYGSSPFGQYSGSGTEAYGMNNGAMGYGQGYQGVPFGYMGANMGGTPTAFNGSLGNTAKGRGTQAPPGNTGAPPGNTSPGKSPTKPGTPPGNSGDGGHRNNQNQNAGGLPWAPFSHDYHGTSGMGPITNPISFGGTRPGTPGGGGNGPKGGLPSNPIQHGQMPNHMSGGNPSKAGVGGGGLNTAYGSQMDRGHTMQ
jgi:hypothetical protein